MFKKIAVIFLSSVMISTSALAEKLIWKQEPFPLNCAEVKTKDAEGDFLLKKCATKLGLPMWQIYQEGVRLSVGFGNVMNIPYLAASTSRGNWPLEWGGVMVGKKFVPKVAIARFNFSDGTQENSVLVGYRLLSNGKSCRLEGDAKGNNQNARLRALAES